MFQRSSKILYVLKGYHLMHNISTQGNRRNHEKFTYRNLQRDKSENSKDLISIRATSSNLVKGMISNIRDTPQTY